MRRKGERGGFTLIEVLAALVILAIGALGIAGIAATASRMLSRAAAIEGASAAGALVMDSLLASPEVRAGERTIGRYRAAWTVGGAGAVRRIELTVSFDAPGGAGEGRVGFAALHAPPPLPLARGPEP